MLFLFQFQIGRENVSKAPRGYKGAAQPKEWRRTTQLPALSPPQGQTFNQPSTDDSITCPLLILPPGTQREQD